MISFLFHQAYYNSRKKLDFTTYNKSIVKMRNKIYQFAKRNNGYKVLN